MRISATLFALLAVACQARASEAPTPEPRPTGAPAPIVARDAAGAERTAITSAHPCAVAAGGVRFTVAAWPLFLDANGAHWTSEAAENGTTLRKDTALAARVLVSSGALAVFDPTGAAWIRVDARGDVHGAGGQLLRSVRPAGDALQVGDVAVTGTRDPLLAAVVSSPELPAEVRALVACNRLQSNEATP